MKWIMRVGFKVVVSLLVVWAMWHVLGVAGFLLSMDPHFYEACVITGAALAVMVVSSSAAALVLLWISEVWALGGKVEE
jgi:hypothetical protein